MSKILVTGGAGFIGAHLAQKLLSRGDEVVIVDDFNDRYDPALKEARVANLLPDFPSDLLIREDVADTSAMARVFAAHKFDVVVHLAAWAAVQRSIQDPLVYSRANVDGTIVLLEEARKQGVGNFVFASSSSVYGGREKMPLKETDDVSKPISPYAATKVAGEALCSTWNYLYEFPISAVRFFTVYGPWGRPEMALFKFTEAIDAGKAIEMRGSETKRDFTYVDDIVNGVLGTIDTPPAGYEIYNLGNSDAVPLPRFINAIETALGKKAEVTEVPLPPGDVPQTHADVSKAKEALGYDPKTDIEEGVRHFVRWYQDWYKPNMQ